MRNTFGVQGSSVNAEQVFQIPRSTRELLKQTTDGVCLESGSETFSRRRHEFRALKMPRVRVESQRKLQSEAALRASIRHQLGGHGFRSTTMYPAPPKRRPTRWKEETMAFHHRNSLPAISNLSASIASPSVQDHTHLPHMPALITSSTSARAMPKRAREG